VWWKKYFDILNNLGMDHQCDRQMDGWTERDILIANAEINSIMQKNWLEVTGIPKERKQVSKFAERIVQKALMCYLHK